MKKIGISEFWMPVFRFGVLLVVYQVLRLLFYAFNASLFPNISLGSYPLIMKGGLRFDISALVYLNLLYFVLHYLSFRSKYRRPMMTVVDGAFVILNSIGVAGNCIDFIYYRFILKRTTFGVLDILKNEDNMTSLWLHFLVDYWYVFAIFAAFVAFLVWLVVVFPIRESSLRRNVVYVPVSVASFAVVAGLSVAGIRGGFLHSTRPIAMSNAAAYTTSPEESAVVLNTPFCFIRTIGKNSFPKTRYFSDVELAQVFSPVHAAPVDSSVMTNRKNVVIFILESFNREFFGCLNPTLEGGAYVGYTPFLDSLSQHCLVFDNAYANGRKSIDAMPSVLASIPALIMPYVVSEYGNNKVNSVASLLGREGYSTAFFHGAANGSMGFDGFAKSAGFDRYYGKNEYGNNDDYDGIWGIWDEKFFQYYANEIGNLEQPFCTALFSLSSHDPFKVPAEYEGVFPKGNLPVEQCIGYSDNALRKFFAKAKSQPWFNNTLFVITADHSSIPDHDEYRNNAQAFAIPIFFYAPGDSSLIGRDHQLAQQADILPSVLAYLGYNHPFVSFGINLFDESNERFVLNYNNDIYQIYRNDTIAFFDGKQMVGAYDMKADPSLKNNVYQKGMVPYHERFAKAYVQQFNLRMIGDSLTVSDINK